MRVPNFFCCATLAFVDEISSMTGRAGMGRRRSFLAGQDQSRISSSCGGKDERNNNCTGIGNGNPSLRRRAVVEKILRDCSCATSLARLLTSSAKSARGACLSGDIRPDCIGVYKLPIDAAESPYVDTPERLKLYAPDLRWIPPTPYPRTYAIALDQLKEQGKRLDAAVDLVAMGDIEGAGLTLLDVIPKVSAAGIVIIRMFDDASNNERNLAMKLNGANGIGNDGNPSSTPEVIALEMKAYRIKYTMNELLGYMGETDVLMGQGLRGELGVSAVAQIQILSSLSDCRKEYDNLLRTVPEKVELV
jgi:hypothetical protein